ncbi:YqaA family protein [Roseateles sp. BYS78W]|uniref:YqaA family protein n=1 Tax=Pelomonas candidula TaxID=3299025 RepID=A0ABW7HG57_9BURK
MEAWLGQLIHDLLASLALPQVGLVAVFIITFISATLLPLGSEPAVFLVVKADPGMFWVVIAVATLGNTLGGATSWWVGYGAEKAVEAVRHREPPNPRALAWLKRFGPKACVLSWLPIVGDPLCAVAGWLKLPFWPCLGWMALGKGLRFICFTVALLWLIPESWMSWMQ